MKAPWVALGLLAYIAFTLALFPAPAAHRWFAPAGLQLAGIEGTVWSGRATLGSVGGLGFHDIAWELYPWSVLFANVSGRVQARFAGGFVQTGIRVGPGRTSLTGLRAAAPLATLATVLPIRGTQGQASIEFAEIVLRAGWPVDAVGELRLGAVAVPPLMPVGGLIELGNYTVSFGATAGEGLAGAFTDAGGPLEVTGSLRLNPNRDYLIEGAVRARPGADAALVQGLEFMTGEPDSAGMRQFSLAGSL